MKISHVNYSDDVGGASKAAHRISEALSNDGIDSRLVVANKILNNKKTIQISSKSHQLYSSIVRKAESYIAKRFLNTNESSLSIHSSNIANSINSINSDIAHFHWINAGYLSISDVAKVKKPKVWTLHDMWPFCATEHYAQTNNWKDGYLNCEGTFIEKKLLQFVWNQKNKLWTEPFEIVAPSRWMADCAKQSSLFHSWPVSVIKNPIDTEKWFAANKNLARKKLGLPLDTPLILFGSAQGTNDPRKGYKYLIEALRYLKEQKRNFELVVFGNSKPLSDKSIKDFKVYDLGKISDDRRLRSVYQSCNVFVLPSLRDNLPNTCVEAIACGIPVSAFNSGGVEDIVINKKTGYLAKDLDSRELANGINWILTEADPQKISEDCQNHAAEHFSYPVIAKKYREIYERLLAGS